ncbi:hypothetical protein A1Q1_03346 [Trichosporon asahii var. asahii CBS 2479]|uniref:CASTOR ACT domain-containing protein n=1 Tax=Trichosporon asahii var. asahii (strain ATCC 90039 / CBS 2479 / JCM 2466 / KCTC 7840 / NBRC 103889/ NCYC 2677 / UAMH 7654) TaxID=1186058 RepID=J5SVK9_TRIAS|nr:hypothetical protein A1Q1_03346 [Trichosporon asahii var. asahii CBS 2479]EJT47771.1 hypothetical protein A1Q1_03346 [Trichosporon asahii var. asahii CBS 2479]
MSSITIDPLETSVSIVHIPVHLAQNYTNELYWTLERARECEFFNLTANRIEIALFASTSLINSEWTPDEHVQIDGPWGVFEISSGDCEEAEANYALTREASRWTVFCIVTSLPHLRHVSAALAEGNVSILYQSSYFTDFLLVKAEDFERAAEIFRGRGWHVDAVAPIPHARRSSHSPPSPPESPIAEITVLSSPLACIGLPLDVEERSCERLRKFLVWPTRVKEALRSSSSSSGRSRSRSAGHGTRPFISYTRTEDGISISTEIRVLKSLFDQEEELLSAAGELDDSDSESSSSSMSQESRRVSLPGTIPLQWSQSSTPTNKSYVITPVRSAVSSPLRPNFAMTGMSRSSSGHSRTQSDGVRRPPPMMRRCSEGAGASLRNWTWGRSSMGLEAVESEIGKLGPALERIQQAQDWDEPDDSGMPTPDFKNDPVESSRTMRCLQLDLRSLDSSTYHLDKSGLVTKFSDLLHSNGVRMLYSSTTNTANILVRGRDVLTAEALLRAPPEPESDPDVAMDDAEA